MEKVSIIISIIALFVSLASFILNCINSKLEKKSSDGQVEIELHKMIADAKNNFRQTCMELLRDTSNPIYISAVNLAIEDIANAYEEACAKYLDGKVDKKRFKKIYHNDIKIHVTHIKFNFTLCSLVIRFTNLKFPKISYRFSCIFFVAKLLQIHRKELIILTPQVYLKRVFTFTVMGYTFPLNLVYFDF